MVLNRLLPFCVLASVIAACASTRVARARAEYLGRELDRLECGRSLDEAWTEARRMLGDRGYPLAGADAKAVGKSANPLVAIFTPARATRAGERGSRTLETGWVRGLRYHLSGSPGGSGCHVTFTAIAEDLTEHGRDSSQRPRRDLELELELVRRLAPEEAARIEAGAPHARERGPASTADHHGFPFAQRGEQPVQALWIARVENVSLTPGDDGDVGVADVARRGLEADDFGAEFTPELRKQEERIRAEVAARH